MTLASTERKNATRAATLCLVIAISFLIPAGVVYCSFAYDRTVKPFGAVLKHFSAYRAGCLKNGEFWYPVLELHDGVDRLVTTMRVHRLDLETGIDCETELQLKGYLLGWGKLTWLGDNLYYSYVSMVKRDPQEKTRICQQIGSTLVDLDLIRFESGSILGPPFEYEGRTTVVEATSQGQFRLVHWVEGKWSNGQEILLPSSDRTWFDDPQRGHKVLLPLSSGRPTQSASPGHMELNVVSHLGENVLVLMDDFSKFYAFRHDFEFAIETPIASALAPANAQRDVSGWMPTAMLVGRDCYITIHAGQDQLYLSLWAGWSQFGGHNKQRMMRYTSDRMCELLIEEPDEATIEMGLRQSQIATNPLESRSYLLQFNSWNSLSIRRIEGQYVRPSHVVNQGQEHEYLVHWLRLAAGLLFAWFLHVSVLLIGASWLLGGRPASSYEYGTQVVALASPTRRSIALTFDLILAIAIVGLSCRVLCGKTIAGFNPPSAIRLCELLYFEFEQDLSQAIEARGIVIGTVGHLIFQFNRFRQWLQWNPEFLVVLAPCSLFLFAMKSYWEGRYGITPGKLVFGIRILTTTLRPAGFARSLARNTILWCDIPLLVTPLPAVVSMAFSEYRQRLGDRVADTIVVRNNG